MSTSLVITPTTGGAATFTPCVANFDANAGAYWDIADSDGPQYGMQDIAAGGVDGVAEGLAGFRHRRFYAECYIVATSEANCKTAKAALDAAFNQACGVALPNDSNSYPASYLRDVRTLEHPSDTGLGTYIMKIAIEGEQKRLS